MDMGIIKAFRVWSSVTLLVCLVWIVGGFLFGMLASPVVFGGVLGVMSLALVAAILITVIP